MARTGILLAALLALVVAGCMGNGKARSTPTAETADIAPPPPPVTHRQFVKRLDRLCRGYNRKIDRFYKRHEDVMNSTDYVAIVKLNRRVKKLLNPSWRSGLRRLQVPPKDRQRFRRYVGLVDRIDALARREQRFILRNDQTELARLDSLIAHARNQRTNVAVDMGLQVCGS
jgi:hypothetical protein